MDIMILDDFRMTLETSQSHSFNKDLLSISSVMSTVKDSGENRDHSTKF